MGCARDAFITTIALGDFSSSTSRALASTNQCIASAVVVFWARFATRSGRRILVVPQPLAILALPRVDNAPSTTVVAFWTGLGCDQTWYIAVRADIARTTGSLTCSSLVGAWFALDLLRESCESKVACIRGLLFHAGRGLASAVVCSSFRTVFTRVTFSSAQCGRTVVTLGAGDTGA